MHELAICQSLLRQVEEISIAHGAAEVRIITIAIGPLSGVEAPLLERAFSVARAGTPADRAVLEIENVPVIVQCKGCGRESAAKTNALLCGDCGDWQVTLKSGDQLLLKRVELVPISAAAE